MARALVLLLALLGAAVDILVSSTLVPFDDTFLCSDLSQLPLDENLRLNDNWLLYLDTPACRDLAAAAWARLSPAFRRLASIPPAVAAAYFANSTDTAGVEHCVAVHLNRGMRQDYLLHVLPKDKLVVAPDAASNTFEDFLSDRNRVEAGWVSHAEGRAFKIYWTEPQSKKKIFNGDLTYGERNTVWLGSVLGHEFEVWDVETKEVVARYVMKFNSFFVIGEGGTMTRTRLDAQQKIQDTLHNEWFRSRRVKRTFTELGFNRGKLPLDLFASMSTYYYNNRMNKMREEWDTKGVFVNWWEKDVYMIGMPWVLKRYWQSRLKDLVEAWSGVELELTDIYGMRRYEDGARLLTHVDREATHAASLIINVAQSNMREPWHVEIYDHADRLHEITMDEGDIVYYESARCLHGRMRPLNGEFYVNLFAHYRPIGDPEWFLKDNPADGPAPLLDIGACAADGNRSVCDGGAAARVPFLSPRLDTLRGPTDLYKYWQATAPVTPPAPAAASQRGSDEL